MRTGPAILAKRRHYCSNAAGRMQRQTGPSACSLCRPKRAAAHGKPVLATALSLRRGQVFARIGWKPRAMPLSRMPLRGARATSRSGEWLSARDRCACTPKPLRMPGRDEQTHAPRPCFCREGPGYGWLGGVTGGACPVHLRVWLFAQIHSLSVQARH